VVLMDLMMPVMDGIAATRAIVQEAPGTAVVALTSVTEDGSVEEAVRAGASGYLLNSTEADDVFRAIRGAAAGQVQLSPEVATQLMRRLSAPAPEPPPALTERETDVLRLLAEGKANKEIARALKIGDVGSLFAKLGVQSRTQAAIHATRAGLVPAGPNDTTPAS
jgi:DNA-binding NarL/FixJ family response regulator